MMTEEELQTEMDAVPDEKTDKEIILELRADIARMVEAQAETTLSRERDWAMERFTESSRYVRQVTAAHAETTRSRDALASELAALKDELRRIAG